MPYDPEGELFFFFFFNLSPWVLLLPQADPLPAGAGLVGARTGARQGSQRAFWSH